MAASRTLCLMRAYALWGRAAIVQHVAHLMSGCGQAGTPARPHPHQAASASRSVEGLSPKVSRISLSSTMNGRSDM